jgi:MFS family permease
MSFSPDKFFTKRTGVVVACTVGNGVSATPMVFTVFGLFLIPVTTEFNWSRSSFSLVLLIVSVATAIIYPLMGRMIDRFGARRIVLPGNLLFAAAVASVSLIGDSLIHLYLAYLLIGITAPIQSSVTFTKVISGWFDHNRGLFLGIVGGLGNGIGASLSPILVYMLLSNYGWRGSYQGIAITIVLIGFPILYLLLWDPPKADKNHDLKISDNTEGMTLNEARLTSTFWIIMAAIGLGAGCMTAIFAHVIPMLIDLGLPEAQATTVLVTFSLVTMIWQVGVGFLLDRVPKAWIAAPFYAMALAGLFLLNSTTDYTLLLFAGVLLGFGLGTEYGVLPYFLSRYFGVKHYGAISGVVYSVVVLSQGLTPFLMALVYDKTGSYDIAMMVIGAGLLCGAILILNLKSFKYVPASQLASI